MMRRLALVLALTTLVPGPGIASGQGLPMPAAAAARDRYFGQLESVNGSTLMLRLRNGRLLHVDAREAFALDRVSEPLFRGKPTVVAGVMSAGGVFLASAVRRAAPDPSSWGADIQR